MTQPVGVQPKKARPLGPGFATVWYFLRSLSSAWGWRDTLAQTCCWKRKYLATPGKGIFLLISMIGVVSLGYELFCVS